MLTSTHDVRTADGQTLVMTRFTEGADGAPPVVLVHGLGQNRFNWHLTRLSMAGYLAGRGMDVFVPELRGHGLSRRAGSAHPATFDEYVSEDVPAIVRAIRGLSGGQKVFYCGHSLGGTIGYALDPLQQEHLRGMIFMAAPYHFAKGLLMLRSLCWSLVQAHRFTGLRAIDLASRRTPFPIDLIGRGLRAGLGAHDSRANLFPYRMWTPGSIERRVLEERVVDGFDRTSLQIMKMITLWCGTGRLLDEDRTDRYERNLAAKTVPSLFVAADRDGIVPAKAIRPAFEEIGSTDKSWRLFDKKDTPTHWGHLDIICGREAPAHVWPFVADWIDARRA